MIDWEHIAVNFGGFRISASWASPTMEIVDDIS